MENWKTGNIFIHGIGKWICSMYLFYVFENICMYQGNRKSLDVLCMQEGIAKTMAIGVNSYPKTYPLILHSGSLY